MGSCTASPGTSSARSPATLPPTHALLTEGPGPLARTWLRSARKIMISQNASASDATMTIAQIPAVDVVVLAVASPIAAPQTPPHPVNYLPATPDPTPRS